MSSKLSKARIEEIVDSIETTAFTEVMSFGQSFVKNTKEKGIFDSDELEELCEATKILILSHYPEKDDYARNEELDEERAKLEDLEDELRDITSTMLDIMKEHQNEIDELIESQKDELGEMENERHEGDLENQKMICDVEKEINSAVVEREKTKLKKVDAYAKDVEENNYARLISKIKEIAKKLYKTWNRGGEKVSVPQLRSFIEQLELNGNAVLNLNIDADFECELRKEFIGDIMLITAKLPNLILEWSDLLDSANGEDDADEKKDDIELLLNELKDLTVAIPKVELKDYLKEAIKESKFAIGYGCDSDSD